MRATRLACACLAALCLVAAGRVVRAEDKADGEAYTVVIKKVEVKTTKADGKSWDINDGKPDLAVIVRNLDVADAKPFETKEATDTYAHDFNAPASVKVRTGQVIEFEVVDRDAAVNDSAGKISKKLTAEMLKDGKMKLENFGQVVHLELEFKKL